MSDERADVRAGFIRQRRSLMAVSLVLLAFQATGATIHTLNLFGNTIELNRPLALTLPLWVAWAYFLIRYYQHFRDLDDRGFGTALNQRLHQLAKRQAIRVLRRTYDTSLFHDIEAPEEPEFEIKELQRVAPGWVFSVAGSVTVRERRRSHRVATQIINDTRVRVPDRLLVIPRLRSVWWVIVHTRLVSEYILPFILAALPVLAAAARRFGLRLAA